MKQVLATFVTRFITHHQQNKHQIQIFRRKLYVISQRNDNRTALHSFEIYRLFVFSIDVLSLIRNYLSVFSYPCFIRIRVSSLPTAHNELVCEICSEFLKRKSQISFSDRAFHRSYRICTRISYPLMIMRYLM